MPGLKCILLTSILSLNCIVPIAAGPLEDGIAAFRGGDYATAIQLLRQFAERGNPSAQFYLGFMYANARGVPKNYAEALKWYRLAADQGVASAQQTKKLSYEQAWAQCKQEIGANAPSSDITTSAARSTAGGACMKKYGYRLKK